MASDGYEVTFGDLDQVAGVYKAQGDALRQALERFVSAANIPPSAFGNLPESGELASQYKQFLSEVMRDMTHLYEGLLTGAAKLHVNAAKYRAAEQASTVRLS